MIITRGLKKNYYIKKKTGFLKSEREEIEAVKGISMKIDKGQIVGLLGVNGAGKTTTIKMLSTLLEPTSGEYEFDGLCAVKNEKYIKNKINMIAGGERMIYWRLSAYENLWYFGQLYGIANDILKVRIPLLLKNVGLDHKSNIPVETFSKGMKQRLQIARGLINDPSYIFMDEPTIGLDAVVTNDLHNQVKALAKQENKGILLTSHYLAEVEELCDYIYIMNNGKQFMEGTKTFLTKQIFKKNYIEVSFGNVNSEIEFQLKQELFQYDKTIHVRKENENFLISSELSLSQILSNFSIEKKCPLKLLHEKEPSLEDVMLKISAEKVS